LESPAYLNDFARGFTGSKQLFDFVDVGSGKDRADDKISGKIGLMRRGVLANDDQSSLSSTSTTATANILFSAALTIMDMLDYWKTWQMELRPDR
jgi:hypothetical protein